jgi:hypothetical protein
LASRKNLHGNVAWRLVTRIGLRFVRSIAVIPQSVLRLQHSEVLSGTVPLRLPKGSWRSQALTARFLYEAERTGGIVKGQQIFCDELQLFLVSCVSGVTMWS